MPKWWDMRGWSSDESKRPLGMLLRRLFKESAWIFRRGAWIFRRQAISPKKSIPDGDRSEFRGKGLLRREPGSGNVQFQVLLTVVHEVAHKRVV